MWRIWGCTDSSRSDMKIRARPLRRGLRPTPPSVPKYPCRLRGLKRDSNAYADLPEVEVGVSSRHVRPLPRDGGQLPQHDVIVLRPGSTHLFRQALWSLLTLALVTTMLPSRTVVITIAAVALGMAALVASALRSQLRMSLGGVTDSRWWGWSLRLRWSEIESIASRRGCIVLRGACGRRIKMPSTFDGHREGILILRLRLPEEVLRKHYVALAAHETLYRDRQRS